jgi:hypothetical protein
MASTVSGRLYARVFTPLTDHRTSLSFGLVVLAVAILVAAPAAHGAEPPVISISSVSGSFMPNVENSGPFTGTPTTPVAFTQEFPVINFNPPVGTVPCTNKTGVDITTRPFTNVVPQPDGSCKTLPAQGKNQQAGVGELTNFQAVFTGAFLVTSASRVTFNFFSDDGWILSLGPSASGAQPVYISGPMLNFPKAGPFTGFSIVGSYNVVSAATQNNLVVSFPAGGTYPFEFDYSDCCEGQLAFTVNANGLPIPATAALSVDIRGIANPAQVQGLQHIEAVVAAGQAQQVELLIDDRSRGISKAPPYTFDWDAGLEPPGKHKVVLRAIDATGGTATKEMTLDVVAAAPLPTLGPVPVAAPVAAVTPVQEGNPFAPLLIAGAITLLLIVGVGCFFLIRSLRETRAPEPATVAVAAAAPVASDSTEFIGKESLQNLTMVSVRRPQLLPKAKLMLKPDREIPLSRAAPTILGRDASLAAAVEDRQVSRHHAKITCEGEEFWIEDLNSTNGTRVNGVPVERQKLVNNDQIGLGDAIVTFSLEPN